MDLDGDLPGGRHCLKSVHAACRRSRGGLRPDPDRQRRRWALQFYQHRRGLPAGLSLSGGGVLSGTPSAGGTNTFTVTATDTNGCNGSQAYTLVVGVVPAISSQPASQTNPVVGTATFTVTATGSQPLSYQWQLNGVNLTDNARITGSQTSTLTIANLLFTDAGNYVVAVANGFGSTNSQPAFLTVAPAYGFTNFAGQPGITGTNNGTGSAALFNGPAGVVVYTNNGTLYVADGFNDTIRKVTTAGVVTTLAGSAGVSGSSNGTGSAALFNGPPAWRWTPAATCTSRMPLTARSGR